MEGAECEHRLSVLCSVRSCLDPVNSRQTAAQTFALFSWRYTQDPASHPNAANPHSWPLLPSIHFISRVGLLKASSVVNFAYLVPIPFTHSFQVLTEIPVTSCTIKVLRVYSRLGPPFWQLLICASDSPLSFTPFYIPLEGPWVSSFSILNWSATFQ